jgi:hypothetical protein
LFSIIIFVVLSLGSLFPYFYIYSRTIESFGVKAGQQVSISVINLNSNIPTFVITEKVIEAETPGLVSLAEAIASSQDLADKVSAFVGITSDETTITTATPTTTPVTPPSSSSPSTTEPTLPILHDCMGWYCVCNPTSPSCSANVNVGSTVLKIISSVGLLLLLLFV